MTGIHDLGLFVIAGLLLNLTPGPDMAYMGARAASGGFRAGVAAVLGMCAGCVVHTFAAALGLSALLAASATAFTVVKWCGAAYLLYAGVRLILSSARAPRRDTPAVLAPAGPTAILREAFVINVFNPKVALFFLAFLPQFIGADVPHPALAFIALGILFIVNSLLVNLPIAWLASRAARSFRAASRSARVLTGAVGGLFVLLAVRLAALERS